MGCKTNDMCDFCDARCANYYEETEDYIVTYNQVLMSDDTYEYCKIIRYKFPKYDEQNGKQILFEIIVPDGKEIKEVKL